MTYEIGQTVYVFDSMAPKHAWATVVKIGRKWVTVKSTSGFGAWRFDKETGRIDGGAYPSTAKVYASRAAYEYEKETDRLRRAISERCSFPTAREISPYKIRQVAKILDVEVKDDRTD